MPNQPPQPLTPAQLETARRDLTELTGGDWFAQAAAWAGPLLATVGVLQTELTRAERTIQDYHAAYRTRTDERDLARDALLRYVDSDQCDCDPVGDELHPCHFCQGSAALGYTVDLEERSEAAQVWLQTHTESEPPHVEPL